jgi:hypothetical protein
MDCGSLCDLLNWVRSENPEKGRPGREQHDATQEGTLAEAAALALRACCAPLGFKSLGEEALVIEVALGGVLADVVELDQQMLHLHPLEEGGQFHVATSSYTAARSGPS